MHTYTHTYIHTHTYTHTCIHTHKLIKYKATIQGYFTIIKHHVPIMLLYVRYDVNVRWSLHYTCSFSRINCFPCVLYPPSSLDDVGYLHTSLEFVTAFLASFIRNVWPVNQLSSVSHDWLHHSNNGC